MIESILTSAPMLAGYALYALVVIDNYRNTRALRAA